MENIDPSELGEMDYLNIWNTMLHNIDGQNLDLTQIVAQAINRLASNSN